MFFHSYHDMFTPLCTESPHRCCRPRAPPRIVITRLSALPRLQPSIKNGAHLLHSTYLRSMTCLVAILEASPNDASIETTAPGKHASHECVWFSRYAVVRKAMAALALRTPLPPAFISLAQTAMGGRVGQAESLAFDNTFFTARMDAQLLEWQTASPDDLRLPVLASSPVRLVSPSFEGHPSGGQPRFLRYSNSNLTVGLRDDATEDNVWVCAEQTYSDGLWYFTVRVDARGSPRR